jgi:ectoine hydroxylase-related dioxygenase (phytanoyl-CoA dioxygenase family)
MSIPSFSATAPIGAITEALDEAGCVVVTDVAPGATCDAIRRELAPHMATARVIQDDDPTQFYPGRTRRVTALVARSETVTDELVAHPISTQVCDRFLLPNGEFGYQLHVTAALEVGPGARAQVLHREDDSFTFFPEPRPNLIVASMWAISEFRSDNGATLVVPGSHRWPADRTATDDEIVQAEMGPGSVLFWLGSTLHGAGPSRVDDWRYGVILTYSLGWLRQEENQYLDVPPERLQQLSPEIRRIVGFDMYRALGFSDPSVTASM